MFIVKIFKLIEICLAAEEGRGDAGERNKGRQPRWNMEADLDRPALTKIKLQIRAVLPVSPAPAPDRPVPVVIAPLGQAMRAFIPGQLLCLDRLRLL
jgi:hypothetical protein